MSEDTAALEELGPQPPRFARWIMGMLDRMTVGSLEVRLPDGQMRRFGSGQPSAHAVVHDWSVFEECAKRGDIAFGETYIQKLWSTDDLPTLLRVLVANRNAIEKALYGKPWVIWLDRMRHWLRRNTKKQAKLNIAAHYDLGNSFYSLWLDPSMTYSSAVFEDGARAQFSDLESAQLAKYQRIVDRLELPEGGRVLEVGCGWGGFAETLARSRPDVHLTALTLSEQQKIYAENRLRKAGLTQAKFELRDYRDEPGRYDGIASIEMFEAVGEKFWPAYFTMLKNRLSEHGRAMIQTIVIRDEHFDRYRRSSDFIQQYIFPGGMLPSPSRFAQEANKQGLVVTNEFAFGQDYATTLMLWRAAFLDKQATVRSQGFDGAFIRMWDFYLAYCEAGFRTGDIDVMQYELRHRGASG